MAIASTKGIDEFDESTILTTNITSMIEKESVKGTGWNTSTHLSGFDPEEAGRTSAESAIKTIGGERISSGTYNVVFGRQPVTDLFTNIVIPALSLSSVNSSDTPFLGKLGKKIASELLTVYDDGTIKGAVGSKKFLVRGFLRAGRTLFIMDFLWVFLQIIIFPENWRMFLFLFRHEMDFAITTEVEIITYSQEYARRMLL